MQAVTLQVLLRLGRVSNLPTVWTNTLAGAALVGAGASGALLPLIVGTSLFYIGGMYLNDAYDVEIDRQERPERPIPSGQISLRTVFIAGFGMLLAGAGLCVAVALASGRPDAPLETGLAALGLGLAIVLYDTYHKNNPLSPLLMGLCRALVYLVASLAIGGLPGSSLFFAMAGTLGYLIGLTYIAKQENLKEIKNLWPLLFVGLPIVQVLWQSRDAEVLVSLAAFALWTAYALHAVLSPSGRNVPAAVTRFIAGVALLDGVWAMLAGQPVLTGVCVLAFAATRIAQRSIPGT